MAGKKRTEAWNRTVKVADQLKPMAAQVKPLAKSTGQAARRQIFRTRAWAAPQVERTGKVLQDTVAPKVHSVLSSAAERIDPAKPRGGRWRKPAGITAAVTAAASAAAAVFRNRMRANGARRADEATRPSDTGGAGGTAGTAGVPGADAQNDTATREHQAHIS
jgi:hypothetical protein